MAFESCGSSTVNRSQETRCHGGHGSKAAAAAVLCVCGWLVVPRGVGDVHIVSLTSTSVVLSWSSIDCRHRNGPGVGYVCELARQLQSVHDDQTSHDVETSHSTEISHEDRQLVRRQVVNGTLLQLNQLKPLTQYVFAVSFRNSDFDGPKTFINFTTDVDGLYHADLAIVAYNRTLHSLDFCRSEFVLLSYRPVTQSCTLIRLQLSWLS